MFMLAGLRRGAESPRLDLPALVGDWLRAGRGAPLLEFDETWHDGDALARIAAELANVLEGAGVAAGSPIGVVARNRPGIAAAILGLVAGGRSITMIYSAQSADAMAADIGRLGLAAIVADPDDWSDLQRKAASRAGSLAVSVSLPGEVCIVPGTISSASEIRAPFPEPGIEMLTSGTTGAPKRILISYAVLERAAESFRLGATGEKPSVQIVSMPFGNISGVCQLTGSAAAGAPIALLERFTVHAYIAAIGRHRPPLMALAPPAVGMILDAGVPPEALAGVAAVFGGGGALPAETQAAFEARYGIPIYWGYGATEFGGTLIRWTPDMHREFGVTKRGSVGRVMAGAEIRVVDAVTGTPVAAGIQGLMEGRVALMGDVWIRTTDLVSIDADAFVWHHGRADGAIVRGGFKILPEVVADALRTHASVADAAVVARADARLGHVPVAAVELRPGAEPPTAEALAAHLRKSLAATHIPVEIRVLDALPRTPSLKVSLGEVRRLFGG